MDSRPSWRTAGPGRAPDGLIRHRWLTAAGMSATIALVGGGGLALVLHDTAPSQRKDCGLVRCAAALPPAVTSSARVPARTPSATEPVAPPAPSPSATASPAASVTAGSAPQAAAQGAAAGAGYGNSQRPAQPFPDRDRTGHWPAPWPGGGLGWWPGSAMGHWPGGLSGWPGGGLGHWPGGFGDGGFGGHGGR
ncbi:MAG TPA: hypothetical protein VMV92_14680 [Streptosporangiaceae bacterium]|nr:hypothetical protein [Streptosporangiaceae bacterium]